MTMVPKNRYYYFYMAKLADQAERCEESFEFMEKLVVTTDKELSVDERNLLSVAYKKIINPLRNAYHTVSKANDNVTLNNVYKSKIVMELTQFSSRILNLLDSHLIPLASTSEAEVFYLKLKGDCYRYLAEFEVGVEKEEAVESTILAYMAAQEIAFRDLAPSHPTRLGLLLNFAVFYYEIGHECEIACSMVRKAFDDAVAELGSCGKFCEKSAIIMQLIRDNLALWTSDMPNWYCE